jgi:hypothetical protein
LEVTQLNKEKLGKHHKELSPVHYNNSKDDKSTCLFDYTPINLKIGWDLFNIFIIRVFINQPIRIKHISRFQCGIYN